MSVDDGHGSDGHPLTKLLEDMEGDAEGVWRDADGHQINDAPISREGNREYQRGQQQRRAGEHEDAMQLIRHFSANDPLYEHKRQLLRDGPDPEVVAEVANNPHAFLAAYDAVTLNIEAEERDSGRNYQLESLRDELKEHDEEFGPRATPMRERILGKIAAIHGGGR